MFFYSKANLRNSLKLLILVLFFCLYSRVAFALTELTISSATASSVYSTTYYNASKAIDKSLTTYWMGASNQAFWWLSLDLGSAQSLTQVSIYWNRYYGASNYSIQGSNDALSWDNLYSGLSSLGGVVNPYQQDYTLSGTYRYIRIYITTAQRSYPKIYEVKLYGASADTVAAPSINTVTSPTNVNSQTISGTKSVTATSIIVTCPTASVGQVTYPTTTTWSCALTNLSEGSNAISVKAKDSQGNESLSVSTTIILDTIAPVILITSPPNGATLSTSPVQLEGTVDGVAFSESRTLSLGQNTLTKTATDAAGNTASASVTVYYSDSAPVELAIASASASSVYSTTYYNASKAIDKSLTTYWMGKSAQAFWWLKLDLGSSQALSQISIFWHKSYGASNYNIQGSNDDLNWINLAVGLSSLGGSVNPYQKDHTLSGSYRYLRIYINAIQSFSPRIYEVKIYGTSSAPILSISVNPKLWNIGSTQVSQIITMAQANKITVTNDGSGPQTLELQLVNPAGWSAANIPEQEAYVLSGVFCAIGDILQPAYFNQDAGNEDVIATQAKESTGTVFGYNQSTANGVAVPAGQTRALYLQFKSPVLTSKTEEQNISLIVSCQAP